MNNIKLFGLSSATLAFSILASAPAMASMVNVTASRSVDIGISGPNPDSDSRSSTAVGIFNQEVSRSFDDGQGGELVTASQNSDISASTGVLSGTGTVSMDFSLLQETQPYAKSFFDVFFDLSTVSTYTLTGLLTANADGGLIGSTFELIGPSSLSFQKFGWGSGVDLNSSGILAAGQYELKVYASILADEPGGYMGGSSSYDFNLKIDERGAPNPTPEPATMLLLGIGLAGLVASNPRKAEADRRSAVW